MLKHTDMFPSAKTLMARAKLRELKAQYLTPENLAQYKATTDKYLFVEYLTDLPNNHPLLNALDLEFYKLTEGQAV